MNLDTVCQLALKSSSLNIFELLDIEQILPGLLEHDIIRREDFERIEAVVTNKKDANKLLVNALCEGGERSFLRLLDHLTTRGETNQELRTLVEILDKTKRSIANSTTNSLPVKKDIHLRLGFTTRRRHRGPDVTSRILGPLEEEVSRSYEGSCKQWFLVSYGILIKNIEVPVRTLFCQLQITAEHGKILREVQDGLMAREFWNLLCRAQPLEPFKDQVTLTLDLQQVDLDLLQHEVTRQQESQMAGDVASDLDATGASALSLPSYEHHVIRSIPLSEMEDSQKEIWRILLAHVSNPAYKNALFYRALKKYQERTDVKQLRSDDEFTILHELIRNKRADLMPSLLYCGMMFLLYDQPVGQRGGEYAGLTPVDLANRFSATNERQAMEMHMRIARNMQRSPIRLACRDGQVSVFKALVPSEPYSIVTVTDGMSCIHWAVISGSIPMVKAVMAAERNIRHVRSETESKEVIVQAITLGHAHMIEPLMSHMAIDLEGIDIEGKSLMEKVAEFGDVEAFNVLRRRNLAIPETVLAIAAACGSTDFVRMCIENHCPPLNVNFRDRRRKTALHFATERGHVAVIELLIEKGADIKARDRRGRSFLHSAAEQGGIEVMNLIIRILQERNALHELLTSTDKHLGSELCYLVRGRDQEQPAWHYVHVDRGVLDIFRIKTRGGAVDVAQYGRVIKSGWGSNPSEDEIREVEGQFDMVNILPTAGPDMLPLHLAILKNNTAVAIRLIELMSLTHLNKLDCFGLTPLHYAAMRGNIQVLSALDHRNANLNALDSKGRSVRQIATINNHPAVIEYLGSGTILTSVHTFVQAHVSPLFQRLSQEELQRRANNGEDLRQYIRTVFRDVSGEINSFLFDVLHAGPVMEESQPQIPMISEA